MLFSVLAGALMASSHGTLAARRSHAAIPTLLRNCGRSCEQQLDEERFLQFAFFEQWRALALVLRRTRHSHHWRCVDFRQL